MKKRMLILILISMLITGLLAACEWEPAHSAPPSGPELPPVEAEQPPGEAQPELGGELTWERTHSSHEAAIAGDDQVYSAFEMSGLTFSGTAAAESINADLLAEEESWFAELTDAEGALFAAEQTTFEHEINYSVAWQDDELLSVVRDEYTRAEGAAHPEFSRHAFCYDAESGQRLKISDVLGNDWQETMVSAIYQQLNEAGELDNYYPGLEKLLVKEFGEGQWYADGDAVHIIYPSCRIAPCSAGAREFAIPR